MHINPFLKWPGGKSKLCQQINEHLDGTRPLVDVFAGAGSIWLNSKAPIITANDINADIIGCFEAIRETPLALIESVQHLFITGASLNAYLSYRQEFNDTTDLFRRACLFIYLNKYGFNGLCRYNKKGQFNVHFGGRTEPIAAPVNEILQIHNLLSTKSITCENTDFVTCIEKHNTVGVMFYLDPPYIPINSNSFVRYSGTFGYDRHTQLRDLCANIQGRFLMSNSDCETTRTLYKDFYLKEIEVERSISASIKGRNKAKELLISNYDITSSSFESLFTW